VMGGRWTLWGAGAHYEGGAERVGGLQLDRLDHGQRHDVLKKRQRTSIRHLTGEGEQQTARWGRPHVTAAPLSRTLLIRYQHRAHGERVEVPVRKAAAVEGESGRVAGTDSQRCVRWVRTHARTYHLARRPLRAFG
jgi:hypothetical protein